VNGDCSASWPVRPRTKVGLEAKRHSGHLHAAQASSSLAEPDHRVALP